MSIRGDYYQILEYFKLLYETRRIITIEDLKLGSGKLEGDRLVMDASFVASTFRQADQPPKAAEAKPAEGKAGAGAAGKAGSGAPAAGDGKPGDAAGSAAGGTAAPAGAKPAEGGK